MAQPARAMDPFTARQVRIRHDNVKVLLWHLEIECGKLREKVAPFSKKALEDDYDRIGAELVHRWLERVNQTLPQKIRYPADDLAL